MERPRIAFAVPRYGPRVLGGAETLCRELAEQLAARGADIDVLTTCAIDHFDWSNELAPGTSEANGVHVRRFPVSTREQARWWHLHTHIGAGHQVSYSEQLEWMGNSVWSDELLEAACDEAAYDWVVGIPYLFGTSYWVAVERQGPTALIPCLHDEPYARLDAVREVLEGVSGCMMNARGEQSLLTRLAPAARSKLVGVGFDPAPPPSAERVEAFLRSRGIEGGYLLYAGRREEAKGLPALFANYRRYRSGHPDAPPLALMGAGDLPVPTDIADSVIELGFVPIEERAAAYAGAAVLLHPSRLESLGMVLMEGWLAGTPVLVNGASEVLREHCSEGGGGLWYSNADEFEEALRALLADSALRDRLAHQGAEYTRDVFSWDAVEIRFYDAIESWS